MLRILIGIRYLDQGWKKFGSGINIPDPQHCKKKKKNRIADLVELAEDLRSGPVAGGGPRAKIKEGTRPPAALLPPHLPEYVLQYGVLAAAPEKQGCGSALIRIQEGKNYPQI